MELFENLFYCGTVPGSFDDSHAIGATVFRQEDALEFLPVALLALPGVRVLHDDGADDS